MNIEMDIEKDKKATNTTIAMTRRGHIIRCYDTNDEIPAISAWHDR